MRTRATIAALFILSLMQSSLCMEGIPGITINHNQYDGTIRAFHVDEDDRSFTMVIKNSDGEIDTLRRVYIGDTMYCCIPCEHLVTILKNKIIEYEETLHK